MFFFHRTPTIHLDCFTFLAHANELTPIVPATKAIPDWWKALPKGEVEFKPKQDPREKLNMRSCAGFLDFYKKGVVLESWADFNLTVASGSLGVFYSTGEQVAAHSRTQRGLGFKDYCHAKLPSPWHFKEKSGVQFLFMGAEWALEGFTFRVMPGIVTFDLNYSTNVNMLIPIGSPDQTIKMGQALAHIIPLSEKRLVTKTHLVSPLEYDKDLLMARSFYGWRAIRKLAERNKSRQ